MKDGRADQWTLAMNDRHWQSRPATQRQRREQRNISRKFQPSHATLPGTYQPKLKLILLVNIYLVNTRPIFPQRKSIFLKPSFVNKNSDVLGSEKFHDETWSHDRMDFIFFLEFIFVKRIILKPVEITIVTRLFVYEEGGKINKKRVGHEVGE